MISKQVELKETYGVRKQRMTSSKLILGSIAMLHIRKEGLKEMLLTDMNG